MMKINGIDVPELVPDSIKRVYAQLMPSGSIEGVPWIYTLPCDSLSGRIEMLVNMLQDATRDIMGDPYTETFMKGQELLHKLCGAAVCVSRINQHIEHEQSPVVRNTLKTFMPKSNHFTDPVLYNRHTTVTGRLTVASGPQILTLPRRSRNIITSRYDGGKIAEIDFVSLEPRVARFLAGGTCPKDIYADVANRFLGDGSLREVAKKAVICALYGAGVRSLSQILPVNTDVLALIRQVENYFGVPDILNHTKQQHTENGLVTNAVGRKICGSEFKASTIVNHFIQSTAVDIALLGFNELIGQLTTRGTKFTPVFIIHDAILIDVHPDSFQILSEESSNPIQFTSLGSFPMTVEFY